MPANPKPPPLEADLRWLAQVIQSRCEHHFSNTADGPAAAFVLPPPPALPRQLKGGYATTLALLEASDEQRLLLLLALAPHLAPELLDPLLIDNQATGRRFTEFGGRVIPGHGGLLPTVDTALFLLAGRQLPQLLAARRLLHPAQPLLARGLLQLNAEIGRAHV